MTPAYEDANTIPYLLPSHCTKLKLTNTRKKQLLKAANRNWDQPPSAPTSDECCGSSCTPCVKDLWKEDVLVWKQRWGIKEESKEGQGAKTNTKQFNCTRIPGSYDW